MTSPILIKNTAIGEGIPKICVPITGSTEEEICREAEAAVAAGADLAEWRADYFENLLQPGGLLPVLKKLGEILEQMPLIFTIRTKEEGGQISLSMEQYRQCCLDAAGSGCADLIDVQVFGREEEKKELIRQKQKEGVCEIASSHDFEKTQETQMLLERFRVMDQTGADILKIAVMPQKPEDVSAIMKATEQMKKICQKPLISMSMGEMGGISRLQGEKSGSAVTFGVVGASSAPGQFPIGILREELLAFHEKISE